MSELSVIWLCIISIKTSWHVGTGVETYPQNLHAWYLLYIHSISKFKKMKDLKKINYFILCIKSFSAYYVDIIYENVWFPYFMKKCLFSVFLKLYFRTVETLQLNERSGSKGGRKG